MDNIPGYVAWIVYARTKLLLTAFTFALARRLKDSGVTCNALHPGIIPGPNVTRAMWARFQTTREEGAQTIVDCCLNPDYAGLSGAYISVDRVARANPQALQYTFRKPFGKKSLAGAGC